MPEEKPKQSLADRLIASRKSNTISTTPTTTTESTSPTAGTTPASTPVVSTGTSTGAWDNEVAPLLIKHESWRPNFTEENSPYINAFKNVLNGKYEKLAGELTEEEYKKYNSFKDAANNFKNILIQIDKGVKIEPSKIEEASMDWQSKFFDFRSSNLIPTEDGRPAMNDKTYELVDYDTYLTNTIEPIPNFTKTNTSIVVDYNNPKKEGPRLKPDAAYSRLDEWDNQYKNEIVNNSSKVIDSWVNTSMNLLYSDFNNPANKNTIYNFYTSAFNVIGTIGTGGSDPNNDAIISRISDLIKGKDIDTTLNIIKENRTGISDALANLGYYTTANIFGQNKDGVGKTEIYYDADPELYNNFNLASGAINMYNSYSDKLKTYKKNAKRRAFDAFSDSDVDSEKEFLFNAAINDDGLATSEESFLREIKSKPPVEIKSIIPPTTVGIGVPVTPSGTGYIEKIPYDKWLAKKEASIFNLYARFGKESSVNNQLLDIRDNVLKEYKQILDTVTPGEIDNEGFASGLYSQGFGEYASPELAFVGVDLTLGSAKKLANVKNSKQENINKLFSIITDKSGIVNTKDVVLLDNEDIKDGLEAFNMDDFYEKQQDNSLKFDNYFANAKDLNKSTVKFERYSNLDGYSYYEFNSGDKKLGMMIPFEALESKSESLFIKTKENPVDRLFHFTGEYILPDIVDTTAGNAPIIKDRKIRLDGKKNNILDFTWQGEDGKWNPESINVGHTTGTTITNSIAIMNSITDQIRNKQIIK